MFDLSKIRVVETHKEHNDNVLSSVTYNVYNAGEQLLLPKYMYNIYNCGESSYIDFTQEGEKLITYIGNLIGISDVSNSCSYYTSSNNIPFSFKRVSIQGITAYYINLNQIHKLTTTLSINIFDVRDVLYRKYSRIQQLDLPVEVRVVIIENLIKFY